MKMKEDVTADNLDAHLDAICGLAKDAREATGEEKEELIEDLCAMVEELESMYECGEEEESEEPEEEEEETENTELPKYPEAAY
jgi:hypothetical protein